MSWYHKEQSTPFDNLPIDGLEFLSGAILAQLFKQEHLNNQKYPVIHFPSGLTRELVHYEQGRAIHLFGGLALPQAASRDEAYTQVQPVVQESGYELARQGTDWLIVLNPASGRGYRVRYDNRTRQIADILRFPQHAMELLPGELRAALPPLYTNEQIGMQAIAPVKYFTPDSNWTWYATEFDGEDLFFGMVSGYVIELGYFSLSELEGVRGLFGLPIERDLHFQPETLHVLEAHEQRLRGL